LKGLKSAITLTKAELACLLFDRVGLNKREAKGMVEAFFEEMNITLDGGNGVKLSGFGNFDLRDKPSRPSRNPKTGEEVPITSRVLSLSTPARNSRHRLSIPSL